MCVYRETFYYNIILLRASEPLSQRVCAACACVSCCNNNTYLYSYIIVNVYYSVLYNSSCIVCCAGNDALLNFELDIGQRRLRRVCWACIRMSPAAHTYTHTMHATVYVVAVATRKLTKYNYLVYIMVNSGVFYGCASCVLTYYNIYVITCV